MTSMEREKTLLIFDGMTNHSFGDTTTNEEARLET